MQRFSPFLNHNGVALFDIPQNEFDIDISNNEFCSRISDCSHKSLITDLLTVYIDDKSPQFLF